MKDLEQAEFPTCSTRNGIEDHILLSDIAEDNQLSRQHYGVVDEEIYDAGRISIEIPGDFRSCNSKLGAAITIVLVVK